MHCLERDITLHCPAGTLWEFIATPANLNLLTPPELDFTILSPVPERMYNGLTVLYEIRIPLFGRQRWLTEIKHIREGIAFVDEQRKGPYRFWYHYHEITALDDTRSRMRDQVHYLLPGGPIGRLVHLFQVQRMLDRIFSYRESRLREMFPNRARDDADVS